MSIDVRARQYGKVFGDWTICELLGKGSEGEKSAVFRLHKKNLIYEEDCAMKVINLIEKSGQYNHMTEAYRDSYEEECQRLCQKAEREVKLMYQLKDDNNIVRYLDFRFESWEDEDSFGKDLLIRMDYLDDLGKHLQNGEEYGEPDIVRIGMDICKALISCHRLNILHRDIKPDNIFIKQNGEHYLLGDFGISKMIENSQAVTTMTGTKAYAAPEQFGKSGIQEYDSRVDIYSLGLTLYEMANGNCLPYAKTHYVKTEDIVLRLSGGPLNKPVNASEELAGIILKACEFHPEDRYQTAKEFLVDLEKLSKKYEDISSDRNHKESENIIKDTPNEEIEKGKVNNTTEVLVDILPEEETEEDLYKTEPAAMGLDNGRKKFSQADYQRESQDYDYMQAAKHFNNFRDKEAFALFLNAYRNGNVLAGVRLGMMYHYGYGCKKSEYYAKALLEMGKRYYYPLEAIFGDGYEIDNGEGKRLDTVTAEWKKECGEADT